MRVDKKKLQEAMSGKQLTEETICTRTGLSIKSFRWIMNNGVVSEEALERIADAAEVEVKEIGLPDASGFNDNVIEFIKDSERATVTFSQGRHKTRIRKLAKNYPAECQIVAENKDGSLCAHIPTAWVRISPPATRTETQRETSRRNILKALNAGNENR